MTSGASQTKRPVWAESGSGLVEFVRFMAVGSLAALANLAARYLLNFIMPFEAAVVLAYLVGMVFGFFLFQRLLFGEGGNRGRRMRRFVWVNILGATMAWALSSVMARQALPLIGWTYHPFEIAHLAGVAAPAVTSYFFHRHYTFA